MGRPKKDPNAESNTLTVGGAFSMRIKAKEIHKDDNGNVIMWKGSGEFINPFTDEWEKLPEGTRGVITKVVYGEGEAKRTVKLNFKEWLEHLALEADRIAAKAGKK